MIEYVLSNILCREFETKVGKFNDSPKMLHVAIHLHPEDGDQYDVRHLYVYAPGNYVYVGVQQERIDAKGNRINGKFQPLCYHDSCWRDTIRDFIFENRRKISSFRAFGDLFDWYDILDVTEEEQDYFRAMEQNRRIEDPRFHFKGRNPFENRGIWVKK